MFLPTNIKFYNLKVKGKESPDTKNEKTRLNFLSLPQ